MSSPPFFKTEEPPTGSFSNVGPFAPITGESFERTVKEVIKNRPFRQREPEPVPPWVADLLR